MIISTGRAYVFVHIPKTGGTSLAQALELRAMKDDFMLGDTPKAVKRRRRAKLVQARGRLWKHSTLADIDGVLPEGQLQTLFAFTMVRNPWDRMVSYYHWLRVQRFDHPAVRLATSLEFADFLRHPDTQRTFQQVPARAYMTMANGVEHCQLYIRLERFTEDAKPLWDHLGFALQMPHLNRSDRGRDYRNYYVSETAEIVAANCAEDIQRFGYRFDLTA